MNFSVGSFRKHKAKAAVMLAILPLLLLLLEDIRRHRFLVGSWEIPTGQTILILRPDGQFNSRGYDGTMQVEGRWWHSGFSSIRFQAEYTYDEQGRRLKVGTWESGIDNQTGQSAIRVYVPFSGNRIYFNNILSMSQLTPNEGKEVVGLMIKN